MEFFVVRFWFVLFYFFAILTFVFSRISFLVSLQHIANDSLFSLLTYWYAFRIVFHFWNCYLHSSSNHFLIAIFSIFPRKFLAVSIMASSTVVRYHSVCLFRLSFILTRAGIFVISVSYLVYLNFILALFLFYCLDILYITFVLTR